MLDGDEQNQGDQIGLFFTLGSYVQNCKSIPNIFHSKTYTQNGYFTKSSGHSDAKLPPKKKFNQLINSIAKVEIDFSRVATFSSFDHFKPFQTISNHFQLYIFWHFEAFLLNICSVKKAPKNVYIKL
jgi:hypothetical protein